MDQTSINKSASGDNTLLDVATADKIDVFDFSLVVAGAVTVIIKDEAGTEFGRYTFAAAGDGIIRPALGNGVHRFTAVGDLIMNLSGTVAVTGDICYSLRQG